MAAPGDLVSHRGKGRNRRGTRIRRIPANNTQRDVPGNELTVASIPTYDNAGHGTADSANGKKSARSAQ